MYEISPELLNGYAPNSHGRHVGSLAWTSLKVKVKGQDHQGQKTAFFRPSAACVWFVWFMLASSFSSDFSRRKPLRISSTGFLWAICTSCHPTNSVKALIPPVAWPHPFFIHHWSADSLSVSTSAHFTDNHHTVLSQRSLHAFQLQMLSSLWPAGRTNLRLGRLSEITAVWSFNSRLAWWLQLAC